MSEPPPARSVPGGVPIIRRWWPWRIRIADKLPLEVEMIVLLGLRRSSGHEEFRLGAMGHTSRLA